MRRPVKTLFPLCTLALLFALGAPSARADVFTYTTVMTPGQVEVNTLNTSLPTNSTGQGLATGTYDTVTNILTTNITFGNLVSPTTAAHFHAPGAPGVAAPVAVNLTGFPLGVTSGAYLRTFTLTEQQEAQLLAGLFYVNVHTALFPGGEIRGQVILQPVPEPATMILLGTGLAGVAAKVRKRRKG